MKKTINVLKYIETSGPGGAETVLLNIAKNLDKNQFNTTVVLHRSRWLHEQLKKYNIDTKIIPSRRSWDIAFISKFVRLCRQLKIEIIHSHLSGANLYSSLAGMILRIPVIATYHNEFIMPGRTERFIMFKSMLVRKLAAKIVLIADFMQKDYIQKGKFSPEKLMTVYNGIDLDNQRNNREISDLRNELGLKDNEIIVGNVANIRQPKGHRYLIETARQVCNDLPDVKFLLIGDPGKGELKKEIEEQIAGLHLENNVKLLGFRQDVHKLLHLMDIFVLSSTSEGLPLSVVEAMAASKPVVATNIGGLPEIVIPDETGYLVEPADSAALAEKLSILIKNEDLRQQMGEKGRNMAINKFSIETMIDTYQNLYKELLT